MWSRWSAAVSFAICLSFALPASAWTSARVRDVRAEITVSRDGSAHVLLDLGVEVLGGWLERLDLEGFDEELVLDEHEPAFLTTAEGANVPARAEAEAGAVTLRFDKHSAARRGLHRVHVRYVTPLARRASARTPGKLDIPWLLPGWEHGLAQAHIVVRGPAGLRLIRDPEQAVQIHERVEQGQSVIEQTRLLVPRSTSWSMTFEAPASVFADAQTSAARPKQQGATKALSTLSGAFAAACLWGLGFLSRRSFRARARAACVRAEPWIVSVRARRSLALVCTVVAGVAGVAFASSALWLVCALLGLTFCFVDRVSLDPRPIPLGRFAPLSLAERKVMRRRRLHDVFGSAPWADAATLLGALGALGMLLASVLVSRHDRLLGLGLVCSLPLWFASSRLRLPRPVHEQVALLLRAAERSLALSCAMRLVAFSVGEAELSSARLRIVPSTRFSGLLRLDVGVDTRRGQPALVLIAVTQTDSLADRALSAEGAAFNRELSPQGHRAAHTQPIDELGAALEGVLSCLARQSQRAVERPQAQQAA